LLTSVQRDCAPQKVAVMSWHGQKRAWAIRKMGENDALNITIQRLLQGG